MKKIVIALVSSLFLIACTTSEDVSRNDTEANEELENNTETTESQIEVDKGLLNVEITLPEMFFEDEELAEIEEEMEKNHDANVSKNDDGSITVKMSKKEHKQLLDEMKDEFIETVDGIIVDDDFASIQDITYSRNFQELTIIVDREGFENSLDGFALFSLGFSSLLYQLFDGKDIEKDKVIMNIIDGLTEASFEEVIFPDVFDEIEQLIDE